MTAVRDDAVLGTADQDPSLDDSMLEWVAIWKSLPKVMFSTTLSAAQGNARLASDGLAQEIERLGTEPEEGDIAIGGATLAAESAAIGLIDEYRARVYPMLVGDGIPFFPHHERRVDLELVEAHTFSSRVVYLRYRVTRQPATAAFAPTYFDRPVGAGTFGQSTPRTASQILPVP